MSFATVTRHLVAATFAALVATTAAVPSLAQEATPSAPQTPEEHRARAKVYREEAVKYRKAAGEHRQMAAAYAKGHPDFKGGTKNPWNTQMQQHCTTLAKDYDKLATDADKAAEFHTLRASE